MDLPEPPLSFLYPIKRRSKRKPQNQEKLDIGPINLWLKITKANKKAEKMGAITTVVLLSSMDVTLTASDGKKMVTVTVLPQSSQ
jgi:hypothetical protein